MNILYLHTHDTGKVISPYGYDVKTPNYQELCDDSLLFNNSFSVAPTCSPSRAGLLTGCYPHQNGMLGLAQRGFKIDEDKHLAQFLNKNGYHTVLCGVQHESHYYLDHDLAYEELGYAEDITTSCKEYEEADLIYWDQKNADSLCNWLSNRNKEKSFFVSFGMHATHRKFPKEIDDEFGVDECIPVSTVKENKISKEEFARFKTTLKVADNIVGKIIKQLKDLKLYDETIIILTTDHGIPFPFHKCSLTDNGIGVLFAMHVPNAKKDIKTYDGLISHIDVFPTICDLLNLEKPEHLVGNSFACLFEGENKIIRNEIYAGINFHTSYEPTRCIRTERYKYIRNFDESYDKLNYSNIDNSPYKTFLTENGLLEVKKPFEALYDLYFDPTENKNVINEPMYESVLKELKEKLKTQMENTNDPLLNGNISIKPEWKVNKKDCYSPGSKDKNDYESWGIKR